MAGAASAAATDISQVPLAVKYTVAPNIMMTLDDSGSMYWEVIPDQPDAFDYVAYLFPRASNIYGAGKDYKSATVGTRLDDRNARFFRSAAGNPLYYDPTRRYEPWRDADGKLWPAADPKSASMNPGNANAPKVSLQANMAGTFPYSINADETLATSVPQSVYFWPAVYFVYTGAEPLTRTGTMNKEENFTRHVIGGPEGSASFPGNKTPGYAERTDCGADACTEAQELQNFANWFSYHRSRLLAARAAIGRAFSQQKSSLRIGYATLNASSTTTDTVLNSRVLRGVLPFEGDARKKFFSLLYSHPVEPKGTPLRLALDDIGQYFKRSDSNSPWRQNLALSSSTELSCIKSYNIVMTDGYWDSAQSAAARSDINNSNIDGISGPTHSRPTGAAGDPYTYEPAHPYADQTTGTLADVAMYYWKNDLRTDLANEVPTDTRDPAFWQHLSTHTIGFGVKGNLSEETIDSAFTNQPDEFTWPDQLNILSNPSKLDDLAHAAVNGRGSFFNTSDPDVFAGELATMLKEIESRLSASAASAVSNPNVTVNDNVTYETSYLPGTWTGDVKAYEIDVDTGVRRTDRPVWKLSCPSSSEPQKTCESSASGLLDERGPDSRVIATYNGNDGVAFSTGTAGLTDLLESPAGAGNGADVLAYLRGDRSHESKTPALRTRSHLLGAIVHSEPVLAREPDHAYTDDGYSAFVAAKNNRQRMLYVGANDGMLHAFNADNGEEEWAYVPRGALSKLGALASPTWSYEATVDGYLTVADVDFGNTFRNSGSADWRTILVGGLGRGGKSFFALDVTDPIPAGENAQAKQTSLPDKVLWEFPNDSTGASDKANMGLAFSRPIIVKHEITATDGTKSGKGWVVLVSSGYNNGSGDGEGYLYVLDAMTGEVIRAISTGEGSASDPSGLGQLSAWVENDNFDSSVTWVYGGDLKGNLWRFDLTAAEPSAWSVTKLATLGQPITSAPELTRIKSGSVSYNLVAVGTGRYLGESDIPATGSTPPTQSFYVIADSIGSSNFTPITRNDLTPRTLTSLSGGKRGLTSTTPIAWNKTKGWFVDFNISGERVNTDPAIALTTLVFVTNVPSADPCVPGGSSHLFQFDLVTGAYAHGIEQASESFGNALSNRPVLIKLPNGKIVALIRKSDGSTIAEEIATKPSGGDIRRISWRELNYR